MEQFSANWALVFLGLGAILLELFVGVETGFDLVLIGISLMLGGGVGNLTGNWEIGVGFSILSAFAYIFFGRKIIKSRLSIITQKTNVDGLVGKTTLVIKDISKHKAGQIKIGSEIWRAEADNDIKKGEKVKVESIEGVTLKVVK